MPMHFCIDDSMCEEPVTVDSSPWLHDWSDDLPIGEPCHGTVLATAAPPPPPPWPPALEAEVEPTSSACAWPQQEPGVEVDAWGEPAPMATLAGETVSTHAAWDAWESTVPATHVPKLFDAWGNPEPASSPARYSTRAATDTTAGAWHDAWGLPGAVPLLASTTSSSHPPSPHALAVLAGHQPPQPMPPRGVAPDPSDAWAVSSAPSSTPPSPLLDAWGNPEPAWDLAPASHGGPFPDYDAWAED